MVILDLDVGVGVWGWMVGQPHSSFMILMPYIVDKKCLTLAKL